MSQGEREGPRNAIQAKTQYESGGDKEAIRRLESVIGTEEEMAKLLFWIDEKQICLRRGTEAAKACYALSDFGLPIKNPAEWAFWFIRPYTELELEQHTKLWYEHLYNSVAKILLLENDPAAPLLLATGGGAGGGETYNVLVIGIGDAKTFGKSATTGSKVGDSNELNVTDSLDDLKGAVDKVLAWIKKTCDDDSK